MLIGTVGWRFYLGSIFTKELVLLAVALDVYVIASDSQWRLQVIAMGYAMICISQIVGQIDRIFM